VGEVGEGEDTEVGKVQGDVGIRDGGIRSEGRSFKFESGECFSVGKGGVGD
jgi:hypothetical protein